MAVDSLVEMERQINRINLQVDRLFAETLSIRERTNHLAGSLGDLGSQFGGYSGMAIHDIVGPWHVVTGSQYDLVGVSPTNTLSLLTPSDNPGAAIAILRTDATGQIALQNIQIAGKVYGNNAITETFIDLDDDADPDSVNFASKDSVYLHIDSDNTTSDAFFRIAKDSPSIGVSTTLFQVDENGNVTLIGTVDGVDIAAHAADVNAHHNQVHVLADTTGLGPDHTTSGLTAGQVLRATSATTAAFQSLIEADLPVHDIITSHSDTGLSVGYVIRATGVASFAWQQLNHSDLAGITEDDHHARSHAITSTLDHTATAWRLFYAGGSGGIIELAFGSAGQALLSNGAAVTPSWGNPTVAAHDIVGAQHTVTGAQYNLVGLTAIDTLGLLTPTSNAATNPNSILIGDANGDISLRRLSLSDQLKHIGDSDTYLEFGVDVISLRAGNRFYATFGGLNTRVLLGDSTGTTNIVFNSQAFQDASSGNWRFGDTAAAVAQVDVLATTEQLRLLYDASNYVSYTVDLSGNLLVDPTGGEFQVDGQVKVGTTPAMTLYPTNSTAAGPDIKFNSSGLIAAEASLYLNIDSNSDSSNAAVIFMRNGQTAGATEIARLDESGDLTGLSNIQVAGKYYGNNSITETFIDLDDDSDPDSVNFSSRDSIHFNIDTKNTVSTAVFRLATNSASIGIGTTLFDVTEAGKGYISGKLGVGTSTVPHSSVGMGALAIEGTNASADGPHVQFTTDADDYPLLQIRAWGHDTVNIVFDAYYEGGWRSSDAGSNFDIVKVSDTLRFRYDSGIAKGSILTWNQGIILDTSGNIAIGGVGSFGGGAKVVFVANATSNPSSNPSGGGIMYSTGGAGTWRGSGGTTTTFGPAEPHCPQCGRDAVLEMQNEKEGWHIILCWTCFIREITGGALKRPDFIVKMEGV